MITANRISPPYWTIVRTSVVREDSSAPRATKYVVSRMKTAATTMSNHTGEESMPSNTATALVRIPAAPTPARIDDSTSANPPIQPMCGAMALDPPHVNTVPASGAASVRCLYAKPRSTSG